MRIRRLLRISGTAAITSVLMVAATIVALLVLDGRNGEDMRTLDEAVRKISLMRSLQPDFSRADNARAIQQWQAVYPELGPILGAISARDAASQTLKGDILAQHAQVGDLVGRLTNDRIGAEVREMITAQLTVRSASMVSDVLTIRDMSDRQMRRETQLLTGGVAASVGVLAAVILVLMHILHRRIALPVARLVAATGQLSAGQLDQSIPVSGNDELAELAEGFEHMRVALRERLHDLSEVRMRLEDANASLEQRVDERTLQLQQAYIQIKDIDEAKSRFFANVSHELRTPLALIIGPVEALLSAAKPPEDWRDELEVIRRNAQTLLAYVNDLLDLTRIEAGRMGLDYSAVDLCRLVRFVADHFTSAASQRGIKLTLAAPECLPAQVDAAKVARVLFNLLANAFKHAPDGSGRIDVALRANDDRSVIEIADNGPGIPPALREAIFQRYVQGAEPQRGAGTGLGLAIAREFVAQHGGSIVADGSADGGALFRVVLPVRAPEGVPVADAEQSLSSIVVAPVEALAPTPNEQASPPEGELPLVLAVEDNPDLRAFIAKALAPVARVATAEDGAAGLEALGRSTPDLIVTDIMMPRLSGDQMVAEVRQRAELADIPIMVLSARADDRLRIHLLRAMVQDYLVKPFAAEELQARVSNLLQIKRTRDLLRAEIASREENIEDLAREVATMNRSLRAAADDMRIARDAAEQATRAKSAFLNMVSHELRTPLTQLELQLALLQRRFEGTLAPKQEEILTGLKTAMRRLARLVVSVLDYSRIESERLTVQLKEFDLVALVADACADMRDEAHRQGLDLMFHTDDALSPWVGDPTLTRIAVHNLLDNAIKYTPRGHVAAQVSLRNDHAIIKVTDTGPGIAAEFFNVVFEPFRHLEEVDHKHAPGIGLGLAIVREIVQALGGRVELVSQPGRGSTFSLILPQGEVRR